MNELNISSYIQTMQPGLMAHDKQEAAGVFLLSAINDQEYVADHGFWIDSLDAKKISRLVNRLAPVPDEIKQASMIPVVIDATIQYFRDEVMKDLNPHLKDDVIDNFVKLINVDITIPDSKKKAFSHFMMQVTMPVSSRRYFFMQ